MPICDVVSFRIEIPPYDCEKENEPKYRLRIATHLNDVRLFYRAAPNEVKGEHEHLTPSEENSRFLQHHKRYGWNCLPPWEADNRDNEHPGLVIKPEEEEKARIRWTRRVHKEERYITALLLKFFGLPNGNGALYGLELTDRVRKQNDAVISKVKNVGKNLAEILERQGVPYVVAFKVGGRFLPVR